MGEDAHVFFWKKKKSFWLGSSGFSSTTGYLRRWRREDRIGLVSDRPVSDIKGAMRNSEYRQSQSNV